VNVAFDHLMVMVADEAVAAQKFSQAGFTVTPRSELPGMANRLICFPSDAVHAACFVELLSVERPDDVPPRIRSFVGSMLGPVALVLAVPDLDVCQRHLSQQGMSCVGPMQIRRRWTLPSNQVLDVALSVLIGDESSLPFNWAIVQHHTVDHYRRPEFMSHPNGCEDFRGVMIAVQDPPAVAKTCEALFGSAYRLVGQAAIVPLQNAQLFLIPDKPGGRSAHLPRASIVGAIVQRACDCIDFDDLTRKSTSPSVIADCFCVRDISELKILSAKDIAAAVEEQNH
jgi:hypothetical protein